MVRAFRNPQSENRKPRTWSQNDQVMCLNHSVTKRQSWDLNTGSLNFCTIFLPIQVTGHEVGADSTEGRELVVYTISVQFPVPHMVS